MTRAVEFEYSKIPYIRTQFFLSRSAKIVHLDPFTKELVLAYNFNMLLF